MIKLTFCLVRRPELTREAFQKYWFEHHGPLVRSVKDELRIKRYVQMHTFADDRANGDAGGARNAPPYYDGVAQLWWDSWEDLGANAGNPKAAEAGRMLLEDERKFIDHAKSPLWWGEEKVIIG